MTPTEALDAIRGYAAANRITLDEHVRHRMRQRHAQYGDVRHALMTAIACRLQPNERWRVESADLDGDEMTLIVVIDDGDIVVTLF